MARYSQRIRCKARRTNGTPCGNYAMHGQLVCHAHGGKTPIAMEKAKARMLAVKVAGLGLRTDVEPHTALLEAIQEAHGNVRFYRELVADSETRTPTLVKNYDEERDRLVAFVKVGLSLGLARAQLGVEPQEIEIVWAD